MRNLFYVGMYARRWQGPGTPYPIQWTGHVGTARRPVSDASAAKPDYHALLRNFTHQDQLNATEADARLVASTLWAPWIVYHEQRGAFTEVLAGGFGGLRHHAIRKHVASLMQSAVHARMGHGIYGANY